MTLIEVFHKVRNWFPWWRQKFVPPPRPREEPPPAPPVPPAPPKPPHQRPNRKMRRGMEKWERERMKRDKFVEPKGPSPRKLERNPMPQRKTNNPPPEIDVPSANIVMQGDDGICYDESELFGTFNFRDTILDQLDRYWVYLRRMRHHDPDSYGFYKEVGATVVPLAAWLLQDGSNKNWTQTGGEPLPQLSPWWKQHRPSFGCVSYGISSRIEKDELNSKLPNNKVQWVPKFMYFIKYKQPAPEVQPVSGGDIYKMVVWWDRPFDPLVSYKMKGGHSTEYAVFVSADGREVRALLLLKTKMIRTLRKHKKNPKENDLYFDIPQRAWGIPREHQEWAKKNNERAETFLPRLFIEAAHAVERTHYATIRVAVRKDDMTAVFGIDAKRTPYFFQDRDITLTESGLKQRIFHIVRAHVRKDGTEVPFHFRGLREFSWADYRVKITVPGRDHFMLTDFDIGTVDSYWRNKKQKMIGMPELGKRLAAQIDEGLITSSVSATSRPDRS